MDNFNKTFYEFHFLCKCVVFDKYRTQKTRSHVLTVLYGNKYDLSLFWFCFVYCVYLFFIVILFNRCIF